MAHAPVSLVRLEPGPLADAVAREEARLKSLDAVRRLDRHDAGLFSDDPAVVAQVAESLGWLDVMPAMETRWPELVRFRQQAVADGFTHAVVLGMGGSSLITVVWERVFPRGPDGLAVTVLDSTDPEAVLRMAESVPAERTLFVVASKSGTTTEPDRFHRYFWQRVRDAGYDPASRFVAITDPDTPLARRARDEGWRGVFLNPRDIGGRYSALSLFGLLPAALADLPGDAILAAAHAVRRALADPDTSPAARLGAWMAAGVAASRDKLTLAFPAPLGPVALWLEQLLAESTGKQGTGILPVPEAALGPPAVYGPDRLLVRVALPDSPADAAFEALARVMPHAVLEVASLPDLGGLFLLWEAATALAGRLLGINPFDQPNVQESKDNTAAMLAAYAADGALPPVADAVSLVAGSPALGPALETFAADLEPGAYVAVMAYVPEAPETTARLEVLQRTLRDRLRAAVTIGYGPRFLHSTGQLHKGGRPVGRFLQLVADPDRVGALPIPGVPETFNVLVEAQARGDLQALARRRRPVLQVSLGRDIGGGLDRVIAAAAGVGERSASP
jgi:transaldolase/glucose-6-phosphate isomerase